jgi:hypothetical protein
VGGGAAGRASRRGRSRRRTRPGEASWPARPSIATAPGATGRTRPLPGRDPGGKGSETAHQGVTKGPARQMFGGCRRPDSQTSEVSTVAMGRTRCQPPRPSGLVAQGLGGEGTPQLVDDGAGRVGKARKGQEPQRGAPGTPPAPPGGASARQVAPSKGSFRDGRTSLSWSSEASPAENRRSCLTAHRGSPPV